jgi:hypothetical protein
MNGRRRVRKTTTPNSLPRATLAPISHRAGTAVKRQIDALVAQLDRVAASEAAGILTQHGTA